MTAHKHAEMIKAKADNMDLVVFYRLQNEEWWQPESDHTTLPSEVDVDYFLCLPKHNKNDQCLHWLNGGDVQGKSYGDWVSFTLPESIYWNPCTVFIDDEWEIRIKPRKEKRWIAVKWDNFYVLPRHYETKEGAEKAAASSMMGEFQYKEIEVEV